MPVVVTHSILGLIAAKTITSRKVSFKFLLLSMVCPALPDIDVLAMQYGVPYEHLFGHRGFTHSLLFALVLSLAVVLLFFAKPSLKPRRRWFLVGYFFVLTASHGLFDMLTQAPRGVALLSPFSNARFQSPWRPIQASPIMVFFNELKFQAIADDFVWLVFPALLILLVVWVFRHVSLKHKEV